MIIVKNQNGAEIDFEAATEHMDADICNNVLTKLTPCTEQEFFTAYETAHEEKFGEHWFLSAPNPVY